MDAPTPSWRTNAPRSASTGDPQVMANRSSRLPTTSLLVQPSALTAWASSSRPGPRIKSTAAWHTNRTFLPLSRAAQNAITKRAAVEHCTDGANASTSAKRSRYAAMAGPGHSARRNTASPASDEAPEAPAKPSKLSAVSDRAILDTASASTLAPGPLRGFRASWTAWDSPTPALRRSRNAKTYSPPIEVSPPCRPPHGNNRHRQTHQDSCRGAQHGAPENRGVVDRRRLRAEPGAPTACNEMKSTLRRHRGGGGEHPAGVVSEPWMRRPRWSRTRLWRKAVSRDSSPRGGGDAPR